MKVKNIETMNENREAAQTLMALTKDTQSRDGANAENEDLRNQLEAAKEDVRTARAERQVIKSIVSAIVVESGVDWARDDALCQLVLDSEDLGAN